MSPSLPLLTPVKESTAWAAGNYGRTKQLKNSVRGAIKTHNLASTAALSTNNKKTLKSLIPAGLYQVTQNKLTRLKSSHWTMGSIHGSVQHFRGKRFDVLKKRIKIKQNKGQQYREEVLIAGFLTRTKVLMLFAM